MIYDKRKFVEHQARKNRAARRPERREQLSAVYSVRVTCVNGWPHAAYASHSRWMSPLEALRCQALQ